MNLQLIIFGREVFFFSTTPKEDPPAPAAPDYRAEQKRWEQWQANTKNSGGQFGFGPEHYTIEKPYRRWGG